MRPRCIEPRTSLPQQAVASTRSHRALFPSAFSIGRTATEYAQRVKEFSSKRPPAAVAAQRRNPSHPPAHAPAHTPPSAPVAAPVAAPSHAPPRAP
eukprot:6177954-Pleurochrysis_carterae.AAC.3